MDLAGPGGDVRPSLAGFRPLQRDAALGELRRGGGLSLLRDGRMPGDVAGLPALGANRGLRCQAQNRAIIWRRGRLPIGASADRGRGRPVHRRPTGYRLHLPAAGTEEMAVSRIRSASGLVAGGRKGRGGLRLAAARGRWPIGARASRVPGSVVNRTDWDRRQQACIPIADTRHVCGGVRLRAAIVPCCGFGGRRKGSHGRELTINGLIALSLSAAFDEYEDP